MKVYVVIQDESYDGQVGTGAWVFKTRKQAEKKLASLCSVAEVVRLSSHYDKVEEVKGDYIDGYVDGWYDNDHDHIYIEEQEVKESL